MSSREKVKHSGIAEGRQNAHKKEHQSEKFDVARLKVREQLTKKGKFDSENGSFIRQQGKGKVKI